MSLNIREEIHNFVKSLAVADKERIAYLAYTGKIENTFRDDFAFYLNKKNYCVARECKYKKDAAYKADLVVFSDPNVIVEFKQYFSFDGKNGRLKERGINSLENDLKRWRSTLENIHGVFILIDMLPNLKEERLRISMTSASHPGELRPTIPATSATVANQSGALGATI